MRHNGVEHDQMAGAGGYEFGPGGAAEINRACDAFWARRGTVDPASRLRPFGFGGRALAPAQLAPAEPAANPAPANPPPEPNTSEIVAELPSVAASSEPLTAEPVVEAEPPVLPVPSPEPEPLVTAGAPPPAPICRRIYRPPSPSSKDALLDYAFAKACTRKRVRTPEAAIEVAENILSRLHLPAEIRP